MSELAGDMARASQAAWEHARSVLERHEGHDWTEGLPDECEIALTPERCSFRFPDVLIATLADGRVVRYFAGGLVEVFDVSGWLEQSFRDVAGTPELN